MRLLVDDLLELDVDRVSLAEDLVEFETAEEIEPTPTPVLATEGGPPEDWARLIGALGVLGQTERAEAIAAEARVVFADNADAVDMIERELHRVAA